MKAAEKGHRAVVVALLKKCAQMNLENKVPVMVQLV